MALNQRFGWPMIYGKFSCVIMRFEGSRSSTASNLKMQQKELICFENIHQRSSKSRGGHCIQTLDDRAIETSRAQLYTTGIECFHSSRPSRRASMSCAWAHAGKYARITSPQFSSSIYRRFITSFFASFIICSWLSTHGCAFDTYRQVEFFKLKISILSITDISVWNILLRIEDKSIIERFIKAEQEHPSPRKKMQGYTVYASRTFDSPSGKSIGEPLLSDFGSAVSGDTEHDEDVQPNVYRAPEVCLKIPWSYSIDIWNVGCLVRCWNVNHENSLIRRSDLGLVWRQTSFLWQRPEGREIPDSRPSRWDDGFDGSSPTGFFEKGEKNCQIFQRGWWESFFDARNCALTQQVNGEARSPCQTVRVLSSPRRISKVATRQPSFVSCERCCSGNRKIDRLPNSYWKTTGSMGDHDHCR